MRGNLDGPISVSHKEGQGEWKYGGKVVITAHVGLTGGGGGGVWRLVRVDVPPPCIVHRTFQQVLVVSGAFLWQYLTLLALLVVCAAHLWQYFPLWINLVVSHLSQCLTLWANLVVFGAPMTISHFVCQPGDFWWPPFDKSHLVGPPGGLLPNYGNISLCRPSWWYLAPTYDNISPLCLTW